MNAWAGSLDILQIITVYTINTDKCTHTFVRQKVY